MRAHDRCMNIAPGGGGGFINEEHQRKCSSAGGKIGGRIGVYLKKDPTIRERSFKTRQANGSLATCGMLNKTHSIETKHQMSNKAAGSNNSQYGTCWVTDGVKPVKIKQNLLDEYLAKGFRRGR